MALVRVLAGMAWGVGSVGEVSGGGMGVLLWPGTEGGLWGGGGQGRPREQGVPSGVVHGTPCCALKRKPQGGPQ